MAMIPVLHLRRLLLCTAFTLGAAAAQAAPALQRVELSLPSGVVLRAHWLPAEGTDRHPAVLALHGCSGLYAKGEQLSARYRETAERLHAAGYAVLMPDSFGSRGLREICQTRYRERSVDVALRAQDARAALAWLAAQPQVDVRRIGVLGWSNGATTTLTLLEQRRAHPEAGEPPIAGAAVFYPGCQPLRKRQADLGTVPLLLQIGALDDWTPAPACEALVQQLRARPGTDVELHVYPDSYHGFDGTAPVRFRSDVPNGSSGLGVHQGGNPPARAQALAALDAFWTRALKPTAAP